MVSAIRPASFRAGMTTVTLGHDCGPGRLPGVALRAGPEAAAGKQQIKPDGDRQRGNQFDNHPGPYPR